MNPRELLILLLGLAIVAVVLRGLYVAIQARRGQIRLAIDKNIPRDVDLDALEMAELPSGGARVKSRAGDHPEASAEVQRAAARANAMDLGDDADAAIPVLMDAVQVRSQSGDDWADAEDEEGEKDYQGDEFSSEGSGAMAATGQDWSESNQEFADEEGTEPEQTDWTQDDFDDDDFDGDDFDDDADDGVIGAARTIAVSESADNEDDAFDEDPDDVLLDYEADDGMSALAPDYDNADAQATAVDGEDYDDPEADADSDSDSYQSDDWQDDYGSDESAEDSEAFRRAVAASQDAADEEQDWEPEAGAGDELANDGERAEPEMGSFDDGLEEFSMSAGERIGYEGKPRSAPAKQAGLFDSKDDSHGRAGKRAVANAVKSADASSGKRKSMFAGFWRKKPADKPVEKATARAEQQPVNDVVDDPMPKPARDALSQSIAEATPSSAPRSADITPLDTGAYAAETEAKTVVGSASMPDPQSRPHSDKAIPTEPSEVLVINVMASHGRKFAGDDLMQVLITSGLKFGEMNIFHQRLGNQAKGPVVFSVANMLNPGSFDLNNMETFRTVGVSLFLALPTAINNLDAFEKMLTVARQLCTSLGGELKDDNRNGMTAQTIEHYRQRVRDFELRQLKAAGSRG